MTATVDDLQAAWIAFQKAQAEALEAFARASESLAVAQARASESLAAAQALASGVAAAQAQAAAPAADDGDEVLTRDEVAQRLRITKRALDALVMRRCNPIPSHLVGRRRVFIWNDVIHWLRSNDNAVNR